MLPLEIIFLLLSYFSYSQLENLVREPDFALLLSNSYFWKEKFRREGIPIEERYSEEVDFWMNSYKRSLYALEKAESCRELTLDLNRFNDPSFLFFSTSNPEKVLYFLKKEGKVYLERGFGLSISLKTNGKNSQGYSFLVKEEELRSFLFKVYFYQIA